MKPLLFERNETEFSSRGLCTLNDCISCSVTCEGTDEFELELEYPIEGSNVDKIEIGRIIYAPINIEYNMQPFQIYRIEKVIKGIITVYAEHVSYRLGRMVLVPGVHGTYPAEIFQNLPGQILGAGGFTFSGNHQGQILWQTTKPMSVRSALFGSEESLLNTYGSGLFLFDKFNVVFDEIGSSKKNHRIKYGVNMLDLKNDVSIADMYTGIVPYFIAQNGMLTLIDWSQLAHDENIVKSDEWSPENNFLMPLDVSDKFEAPEGAEDWWRPTDAEMWGAAHDYMYNNQTTQPDQNIEVKFVDLRRSTQYADWKFLENILYNDTIEVVYEDLGVNASARVVRTKFDVLAERYESLEIGKVKNTLYDYFKKMR